MPIVMLRKRSDTYDKEMRERNKIHESFEEIANTYLKTSASSERKPASKKKAFPVRAPWVVAAICLVIALAIFISNSNFDVKIRILNKTPFTNKISADDASSVLSGKETVIIRGGQVNSPLVGRAIFAGDALSSSRASASEVSLSNSGGSGAASYRIEFKQPLNLSRYEVGYFAKSVSDGTRLVLVMTDSANKSYRVDDDQVARLSKEWHLYNVNFKPVKNAIDLTSVSSIRFEFGSSTAGNPPNTSIALRDIYLAKAKRLRWL